MQRSAIVSTNDLKRAATFVGLAYALSWAAFYGLTPLVPREWGIAVYVVFMFGPLAAALLTAWRFDKGRVISMLALRARFNLWWFAAWAAPVAITAASWGVSLVIPGVTVRPIVEGMAEVMRAQGADVDATMLASAPHPLVLLLAAAVFGGAINTFAAIGEEAGWRGYLWTLLRPHGFWRASAAVGVIWGVWHAPLVVVGHNYGLGYMWWPWMGITMMTLFTLAMSPLLGFLRDRTGTAWAPALFHGVINAVAGLALLTLAGGHPLLVGVAGLSGVVVLAVASLGLLLLPRREPIAP